MARGRTYSRWPLSKGNQESYRDLTPQAQQVYSLLYHSPDITHCGIVDWRPGRLIARSRGMTVDYLLDGAVELEMANFVLFDVAREEALVCDHIFDDESLRNPKNAVALSRAYAAIASRQLRAAVVTELHRCAAQQPEFSAWSSPISRGPLADLLDRPGLDAVPYVPAYADRLRPRSGTGSPSRSPAPSPSGSGTASPSGLPIGSSNPDRSGSVPDYQSDHQPKPHPDRQHYQPDYQPDPTKNHEPRTMSSPVPAVGHPRAGASTYARERPLPCCDEHGWRKPPKELGGDHAVYDLNIKCDHTEWPVERWSEYLTVNTSH